MGGCGRPRAGGRDPRRPPAPRARPRGAGGRPAADGPAVPARPRRRDRERAAVLELDRARATSSGSSSSALALETLAGPVNAVAPAPVTNREFTRVLGRVLGRPDARARCRRRAVRLLLGEMGQALLLDSARVLPRRLERAGFRFRHPDLEAALRAALADRTRSGGPASRQDPEELMAPGARQDPDEAARGATGRGRPPASPAGPARRAPPRRPEPASRRAARGPSGARARRRRRDPRRDASRAGRARRRSCRSRCAGRQPLPAVADRLLVDRAIREAVPPAGGYFSGVLDARNFPAAVLRTLLDVKRAGLGPAELAAAFPESAKVRELAACLPGARDGDRAARLLRRLGPARRGRAPRRSPSRGGSARRRSWRSGSWS